MNKDTFPLSHLLKGELKQQRRMWFAYHDLKNRGKELDSYILHQTYFLNPKRQAYFLHKESK